MAKPDVSPICVIHDGRIDGRVREVAGMRWRGRRQSTNVQDLRGGTGPARFPGGLSRLPGGFSRLPGGFGRGWFTRGGFTRGRPGIRRAGGGGLILVAVIVVLMLVFGIAPG